jgi:hypothetical protein
MLLGWAKVSVWERPSTVNDLVTSDAAEYVEFPPCEAVIEHVPGASGTTVFPEIRQIVGVLLVNVTVNPDDAE